MLLNILLLFPLMSLASLIDKRCDIPAPPVTVTSLLPTQTFGPQDGHETVCSMTYTTVLPTLVPGSGPGSLGSLRPCTYTVTYGCGGTDSAPCRLPDSPEICPPGLIRTTTVCDTCGGSPVTYTLTVLDPDQATAVPYTDNEKASGAEILPSKSAKGSGHCASPPCPGPDNTDIGFIGANEGGNTEGKSFDSQPAGSSPTAGADGADMTGADTDDGTSPEASDQDSQKHVEVSAAGAGSKGWQGMRLTEATLWTIILAAVNVPL